LTYKHQRSIVEQQWSCKLSKIQKYFTGSYWQSQLLLCFDSTIVW
jgi:hypothetical protein